MKEKRGMVDESGMGEEIGMGGESEIFGSNQITQRVGQSMAEESLADDEQGVAFGNAESQLSQLLQLSQRGESALHAVRAGQGSRPCSSLPRSCSSSCWRANGAGSTRR